MVLTILALAAVVGVVVCEPACSRFEYEKQTLEKVIRMEFDFERQSEEYKELKNRILDILEQVKDERKDLEMERENMQKLQTELRETMSMHVDNIRELMSEVARNQSFLVDTLNTTVRQTLDTVRQVSPIIFFSYRGVSSTPSTGQAYTFTTKTAERGTSGYDASTGRFTASIAGLYLFTVNACVQTSQYLNLQIVQDDAPLLASSHYDSSGSTPCFSLQAFADLTSGQQVWVKCASSCNYYQSDGYRWMQFSGALIQTA